MLKSWSITQAEFQINMERLLCCIYGIPTDVAAHAIRCFFYPTKDTFRKLRPLGLRSNEASRTLSRTQLCLSHCNYPVHPPVPGGVSGDQHKTSRAKKLTLKTPGARAEELAAAKDDGGRTALHEAARGGHLDQVQGGVTADQLAAARDNDGRSALHEAARCGHLDQVQGGVTAKQLAAAKDDHGWTALHYVAAYGHLAQIKGELNIGQLLGVNSNDGTSALDAAIEGGHLGQALGPEPIEAWAGLLADEQKRVRDALKEKGISEKIARVIDMDVSADQPKAWM